MRNSDERTGGTSQVAASGAAVGVAVPWKYVVFLLIAAPFVGAGFGWLEKSHSGMSSTVLQKADAIADIGLQLLKRRDALALCEEVSDVEVTSVTTGSASPYNGPNRVPAYIVDYRLGCYSAYDGKSTQLWRIGFAKDAHTGDFYCMKWGDAEFRDEVQQALKASCSFTSP